jgi:Rrf2 family protein
MTSLVTRCTIATRKVTNGVLQLTRKADYGLRLMLEAAAAEGSFVTIRTVSRRQRLPYAFLRRAASALASRDLLVTSRGPHGGVRLARSASAISLLEVANAFGGVALNACTSSPPTCARRSVCPALPAWIKAQGAVDRALGETDLESVLRDYGSRRARRQGQRPRNPVESRTTPANTSGVT